MATINLTAEDLEQLSRQLQSWKTDICNINNRVKNTIQSMDGWRDPQYQMFLNAVTMTHGQLAQYAESMEQLARTLKLYAQQQREMVQQFNNNMNTTRR